MLHNSLLYLVFNKELDSILMMTSSITSLISYEILGPHATRSTSLTLSSLTEHTFCDISCRCQLKYKQNKVWTSLLINRTSFSNSCELLFEDGCSGFKIVAMIIFCNFCNLYLQSYQVFVEAID